MEEQTNVLITVEAILIIDRDEWSDDWDLKKEISHQLSLSDAEEIEVTNVKVIGP